MAKSPFNLSNVPARNPGSDKQAQRVPHSPAKTAKHAAAEGETLLEAAVEEAPPVGDVGSNTPQEAGNEHGEGHVQRPVYPAANPWPEAKPVAHKPFKL